MEDIQKFLGHSTITTTEGIYAHFDDSQHKETIMKLSDYLSNKTKDDKNGNVLRDKKRSILYAFFQLFADLSGESMNKFSLII